MTSELPLGVRWATVGLDRIHFLPLMASSNNQLLGRLSQKNILLDFVSVSQQLI